MRESRRRPAPPRAARLATLGVLVVLGALALWTRPAVAHAFLVRSEPAPGARLATAPHQILLQFSESLTTHGSGIDLAGANGGPPVPLAVRLAGPAMVAPLPQHGLPGSRPGVFTVTWRAVSAVDGHLTTGSLAFGVGPFSGTLPAPTSRNPFPNLLQTAASWLVVAGAAGALGGLSARPAADLRARPAGRTTGRSVLVPLGLGAGLGGAALQTVVTLASPATSPPRLTYLALASAAAFGAALAVLPWTTRRLPSSALAAAALVLWVGAGHGPAQAGRLGWATEAAHVVAVSIWGGSLLQLVLSLVRDPERAAARRTLAGHARVAGMAVLVVAGTGVALAYEVLPGPGAVISSVYGRIIVAKSVLLATALALAALVRFRGSRRAPRVVMAETVVVLAAMASGSLLAQVGPPAPGVAVGAVLGAPPPTGPVLRAGGLAGDLTVGLTVSSTRLVVEVYAGQAQLPGTEVRVARTAGPGRPGPVGPLRGCGAGCFSAPFTPAAGTGQLAVVASAPGWQRGTWVARLSWPPPPQDPGALAGLVRTLRVVPRVHLVETVHTAGGQAPPATEDVGGAALLADEPWANGAQYVTGLPGAGRGLDLYLPGGPIWDTLTLDAAGRPATEEIVTSGNRIDRQFTYP